MKLEDALGLRCGTELIAASDALSPYVVTAGKIYLLRSEPVPTCGGEVCTESHNGTPPSNVRLRIEDDEGNMHAVPYRQFVLKREHLEIRNGECSSDQMEVSYPLASAASID